MAIKRERPGVPDLLNACMRAKNLFMKLLWQWNCFYWCNCKDLHNWGFLESYIFAVTERFLVCWLVESYCSIREYRPWKWHGGGAICFPLSLWAIFWETSMELGIKTVSIIVKKTNQQFSMVWTLINQRNDAKMFKTLQWNRSPFLLSLNILALLLKSIRVLTMGRWCRFVIDG